MAVGTNIRTYYQSTWHDGDVPIMRAADHGAWLGSGVFDGARFFNGVTPDLLAHCQRVNASARALMVTPTVSAEDMVAIIHDGLRTFGWSDAVYIRPMYWGIDGDPTAIIPQPETTGFAICLEQIPMAEAAKTIALTTTRFRRPVLESAVVNAKAGCLYPNNARMLAEARSKGYPNALVTDAMGNVAETATANIFMVRDGEVLTPAPNGTFLAGITRARVMGHLLEDGVTVKESILTYDDFSQADEVFMTGNMNKVTPVSEFDGTHYQTGPIANRAREMYWDWAASETV